MAAPGASTGQEQQNRLKILEDLQQQKKRLQMQTNSTTPGAPLPATQARPKDGILSGTNRGPTETRNLDARQRQALQHANSNSSAFFITQDSSFGNLILPVIPRLPAE
ncbi:SOSS complex subunit C-like [Asterias rubens]|uniref:SOSS complex subunit C-like n=1 Tax=Asterias rubens TaxID=7604 RepID=UPI001455ADE5|nr:SOSS complex subunit C-like [Asterias rubens]